MYFCCFIIIDVFNIRPEAFVINSVLIIKRVRTLTLSSASKAPMDSGL